jgi:hypothetical protein
MQNYAYYYGQAVDISSTNRGIGIRGPCELTTMHINFRLFQTRLSFYFYLGINMASRLRMKLFLYALDE